jgi:transcriptional regulator with XRE-family HTH domain
MDWKQIINDVLEHQKINQAELARVTNSSTPYICQLKNGNRKSPSFEIGVAIIKLHPRKKDFLK